MEKDFESIMDKLKKLKALADRGCAGEAHNARRLLEKMCAKYGVRLEELAEEKPEKHKFVVGRSVLLHTLFSQCYGYVMKNKQNMSYWRLSRNEIVVECTKLEYVELLSLYEWHKANFEKEFEEHKQLLLEAYISKHSIYPESSGGNGRELTSAEIERLLKIRALEETLEDVSYHKQLESK